MPELLSVNTVFFTVLNYPMSYIEFVGTVLYLSSVWLIAQRNMLTWPVGIISVVLYMFLFYQIQLYSDCIEQIYYLGASLYGWWFWRKTKPSDEPISDVRFGSAVSIITWLLLTLILATLLGGVMTRIHIWLPSWFPEPASYPYIDALTTVMSFVAMWLLVRKHIESWIYWIVVDVIGIWLYFVKDVKFLSLLYVLLLILATRGLIGWIQVARARPNPTF